MKKILILASMLMALVASNAFAVNLTFKFDVNSSGPSIYPCNAGIRHIQNARTCKSRIDGSSCTLGCANGNTNECTGGTNPNSCVCTGEDNGLQGTWRLDFLKASYADWTDNNANAGSQSSSNLTAINSNSFNSLFTENAAYGKQLTSMTVNLGSEVYGADYYVDVCYRGPQIDYTNISDVNFALKAKVTVTNLRNGASQPNYQNLADLKTKAEVKCYMDNSFSYNNADSVPTTIGYNWFLNSSVLGLANQSAQELNLLPNINSMGSTSSQKVPRFCVVRYHFSENSKTQRLWKLQQAQACTYTEISEPSEN